MTNPQPQPRRAHGRDGIWLRMTKAGTNYTAEASFDGTTWQAVGAARHQRLAAA